MENNLAALFSMDAVTNQLAMTEILERNKKTAQYGLTLSAENVTELMETRKAALAGSGRIEIGGATIGKLIDAFFDSCWISQRDYTATLHELTEAFYYIKNESEDSISDDELIGFMKDCYENRCGGSVELLVGRELEKLAHNLRFGVTDYRDMELETPFEEDIFREEQEEAEREYEEEENWDNGYVEFDEYE